MKPKRILLKISGESLTGDSGYGIEPERLQTYVQDIKAAALAGFQIGLVVGGGNIFRGISGISKGFERVKGDQMGMLATVINSLALESAFLAAGQKARVFTAIRMEPVGTLYQKEIVSRELENNTLCLLAGGTGNPFFTTDTAAALRAVEIQADLLLKGTRVNGVFTADPEKHPDASRYETLTYHEAIEKNLKVMDMTAFALCMENNMPLKVFNMNEKGNLLKVLRGEGISTLVNH